jgi:predicted phosphodiesterase
MFTANFSWGRVLGLLVVGMLAGCQAGSPAKKSAAATAPLAVTHGPFLQAPSETGVTVSWATSRKCASKVEYRLASAQEWLSASPVAHHGLVDTDTTWHNVPITGLLPGSNYLYRVVSREIVNFKHNSVDFGWTIISPEKRFTTFNTHKASTTFLVLNDRHEKVKPLTNSLATANWTNVDLVIFNGDMVNGVTNEAQILSCVVDPCTAAFGARTPLVYVRGNHDTRGVFARQLYSYFPTDSGRYYYCLYQGPVAFLVLDCGEDKGDENVEYSGLVSFAPYMEEQVRWLARQIQEPAFQQAKYRVCLLHHPPSTKADAKFIRGRWIMNKLIPLMNKGKVDLLITAHTHKYDVLAANQAVHFPMITGDPETVIRCEAGKDQIRVQATTLSGKPLPQLVPIKAQTGK